MRWRIGILLALMVAAIVVALLVPRIPQDPAYHVFSDQRTMLGIPNFWNVASNVPFFFAGLYGLWAWSRSRWGDACDRWPWLVVGLAGVLICLGSGYYHLAPDNHSLYWDRLPMTLGFMGILSATIAERIHARWGLLLLAPFLVLGLLSVELWSRGEVAGVGDLRFYALVQFYPMIALPLMLVLFPARYSHTSAVWWMVGLYGFAKLLELTDRQILTLTGGAISGHSLKHVAGAAALAVVFHMLLQRHPLATSAKAYYQATV